MLNKLCLSLSLSLRLSHKSNNPPVPIHYSGQTCAYFFSEWCIVRYGTGASWDLRVWSIAHESDDDIRWMKLNMNTCYLILSCFIVTVISATKKSTNMEVIPMRFHHYLLSLEVLIQHQRSFYRSQKCMDCQIYRCTEEVCIVPTHTNFKRRVATFPTNCSYMSFMAVLFIL